MAEVPVNAAVLQWARMYRGLSEEDAADRLGMTVQELREYEAGVRKPTLTVFEDFAAQYRLPQATLFRATRPAVLPPQPSDYRTFESRQARHSFDYNIALSTVRGWLFQIERIVRDDEDFTAPHLPSLSLDEDDPTEAGERERRRIGASVRDQLDWKTDAAFRQWRARLERRGILVFQQKFPLEDCRGFTLYETEGTPTIVVNKSERSEGAKCFTLIHEYCHLLLRKPGVSDHNARSPVETYCNKFAAGFLIPTEGLRAVLPYWPNDPVEWSMDSVSSWAKRLKVSRTALAIRLEQAGLAPHGFAGRFLVSGQAAVPMREPGQPNSVTIRLSEIGGAFADRVMGAYDRRLIDEVQAAEALGLSAEHFEAARAAVIRQREMAGA
jgi:Zn-dependent peptidase ImmA (M78 family)/DNA-binding XRE family transcriptional regulator